MSKFKKEGGVKSSPAISTASLPDIVFMLLFFFMVTTVMRETDLFVEVKKPEASEVTKLEKKSLVFNIYVGTPTKEGYGKSSRIQLDDQLANGATEVGPWIVRKREKIEEKDVPYLTTSLKVDKDTKMGIITAIKSELREVDALKINYSTAKKRVK